MRNYKLITLIILFSGLFKFNSVYAQLVEPVNNSGKYSFQTGNIIFEVNANNGARISSLKIDGNEFLWTNTSVAQMWGSTIWFSPQNWSWPPNSTIDNKAYTGGVANKKLRLESGTATGKAGGMSYSVKVAKTFYVNSLDTSISMDYTIINTSASPFPYGVWEITRVPTGGMIFFPKGEGDITGDFGSKFVLDDNIAYWDYDSTIVTKGIKSFADCNEGWQAFIDNNRRLFVKVFPDNPPSAKAPNENEVEFYVDGSNKYIELELQGAYKEVAAGDSMSLKVKWYIRQLPKDMQVKVGNKEMVDLARSFTNRKVPTGISRLNQHSNFVTYPNPASDRISFNLNFEHQKTYNLLIFDQTGKVMISGNLSKNANFMDISKLSSGVYIYRIKTFSNVLTGKLVVTK